MKRPGLYGSNKQIHQRILLSYAFQLSVGLIGLICVTAIPLWGVFFWQKMDRNTYNNLLGIIFAFTLTTFAIRRLLQFPGAVSVGYVLPTTSLTYGLLIVFYLLDRITYSNQIMLAGYFFTLAWCYLEYFIGNRYRTIRFALVPFGDALQFSPAHGADFSVLKKPAFPHHRFNAVIADLHSPKLTPQWERFLAYSTLKGIPVYHSKQIKESLTGRVRIDHLSENVFGSLSPSVYYQTVKRFIDLTGALLLSVLLIPLFILTIVIIRIESKGPAFFLQPRMGYRGRTFTMIKFRSMYINKKGKKFTSESGDPRITKVGKFIRKFRVDELPQIFNIILGQMSFIGPRPESLELSAWYEKEVPFFAYRHIVRPGISGWAQVELGYAAEIEGMKQKLEYDFYYIKNFSFWLDILIFFKTVRTVLTGFGAR